MITNSKEALLSLKIGIILGSTRPGRNGEAVAKWVRDVAAKRTDAEFELVDLLDYDLPHLDEAVSASQGKYAGEHTKKWAAKVADLDGYVFVTPEYNHGYPGQLKNAIDHVHMGWWYKPISFVSYGGTANGARAVEQLRSVAVEVRMVPVRSEVNIRLIGLQADEAGRPTDPLYAKFAKAMIDQLLWWARVAKDGRDDVPPPTF